MTGPSQPDICAEFSKFLLKRDVLLSLLTPFTDYPNLYAIWKASYKDIVGDLGVTTTEEIHLLVKWLGANSR